jgi:hypothetical protein
MQWFLSAGKKLSVERASGRIKAILRERRTALALLASRDTKGRQITNDTYLGFLEEVKAGFIDIETIAEAVPRTDREAVPTLLSSGPVEDTRTR